jgi:hypothetical protein
MSEQLTVECFKDPHAAVRPKTAVVNFEKQKSRKHHPNSKFSILQPMYE